jgi:hypothetical protein
MASDQIQTLGVGAVAAGFAAKGVPSGEHGFEEAEVERWIAEHGLDVRLEVFEHRIRDPTKALEAHLGIGIVEEGTHPLYVAQIGTSHGDEGPHSILR